MDRPFPRLHVVTDTRPGRDPLNVVNAAVSVARVRACASELAVQVRVEDTVTDRQAYELTVATLALCRPAGVLCLVNDRLQVALAAGADGCHVGADDLPVAVARHVLDAFAEGVVAAARAGSGVAAAAAAGSGVGAPAGSGVGTAAGSGVGASVGARVENPAGAGASTPAANAYRWRPVLGATSREPATARAAVADGATYLGVGPAYGTTSKEGLPAPIGPAGVGAVARAVPGVPVIAIGGVTVDAVASLVAAGAHGVAVVSALSAAADPARAAAAFLGALTTTPVPA